MQKSQRGLLQTLLCQIFRADPDLVTIVAPYHHPVKPWDVGELIEAFEKLTKHSSKISCFCFFIDALDEYDGREEDIIKVLRHLVRLPNVKVCASSRPWPAFEEALSDSDRMLIVQQFTMIDMEKYVHGMLTEDAKFQRLAIRDPRCNFLVPEIANRAQGVWLWVFLVVRDLVRDISTHESYSTLQRRLDKLPETLELYFKRIMSQIDPLHRAEAAQIFLMVTASIYQMPLFAIHFLEYEREDPCYAEDDNLNILSDLDVLNTSSTWMTRLKKSLSRLACCIN